MPNVLELGLYEDEAGFDEARERIPRDLFLPLYSLPLLVTTRRIFQDLPSNFYVVIHKYGLKYFFCKQKGKKIN